MNNNTNTFIVEDAKGIEIGIKNFNQLFKLISSNQELIIRCDNYAYRKFHDFLGTKIMTWVFQNEYNHIGGDEFNVHIIMIGKIPKAVKDKHEVFLIEAQNTHQAELDKVSELQRGKFPSIESFSKSQQFNICLFFWSTQRSKNTKDHLFEYSNCTELTIVGVREALKAYAMILALKRGLENNPYVSIEATLTFDGSFEDINDYAKTFFLLQDDYDAPPMEEQDHFYNHITEEARNVLNYEIIPYLIEKKNMWLYDDDIIKNMFENSVSKNLLTFYDETLNAYLQSSSGDLFDKWESRHKLSKNNRLIKV